MNKERKIIPEKIHVVNIKTLKGNINADNNANPDLIRNYRFTHTLGTGINIEERMVGLRLTVDIEALDEHEAATGTTASYTHNFVFHVENLDEFVDVKDEGAEVEAIDPILLATLVGIAYSTVRGIVHTRTQSTPLNGLMLPVIDPKKLLEADTGEFEPN